MSGMPTTQQNRARHAWETVQDSKRKLKFGEWDEFDNEVKRLGPRIVTAGLGLALAYAQAKKGEALVKALGAWVLHKGDAKAPADLQDAIRKGDSDQLRRWTAEALEWIVWVKRFADAESKARDDAAKTGPVR